MSSCWLCISAPSGRPSRPPSPTTHRPQLHCWRWGRVGAAGRPSLCPTRRGPWSESSLSSAAASPASPAVGTSQKYDTSHIYSLAQAYLSGLEFGFIWSWTRKHLVYFCQKSDREQPKMFSEILLYPTKQKKYNVPLLPLKDYYFYNN